MAEPYRLGEQYAMSHQQIADELGISQQRVWQLERKALRKLRTAGLSASLVAGLLREVDAHRGAAEQGLMGVRIVG